MDTRFWGPSGWRLLHLIAAEPFSSEQHKQDVFSWFCLLPYVLPCKYCRASFSDYLKLQPLTLEIMKTPSSFGKWLYEIHNRVNEKLRGQGLITEKNPSWSEVHARYTKIHKDLCSETPLLGWDFMTSVAFTTPDASYTPIPMPDTPEDYKTDSLCNAKMLQTFLPEESDHASWCMKTRNRYNLLTREERLEKLKAWWCALPKVLPCEAWRSAWDDAIRKHDAPPLARGRKSVMRWMWSVEQGVCAGLRCPTPHSSFPEMNAELKAFESGCAKARRGKTCRAKKEKRRHQIRQTRKARRGWAF
jgi:hypothetical protein